MLQSRYNALDISTREHLALHLAFWILTLAIQVMMSVSALVQLTLCIAGIRLFRRGHSTAAPASPQEGVTVLIPARNEAAVLQSCVNAIRTSDYAALSIIIVDDDSTDGTGAIADQLARNYPNIHVIHRTGRANGQGKGAALNTALPLVQTPLVAIFDADNLPETGAISRLVSAVISDPNVEGAVGQFRCRNHAHNMLTRLIDLEGILFQTCAQGGHFTLFGGASLTGTNYVIRTACLNEVGGWDPGALTEDCDLTVRLGLLGRRLIFVPEAVSWEQAPQTVPHWRRQRIRWARGNLHVLQKLLRSQYPSTRPWAVCEWTMLLTLPYYLLGLFLLLHLHWILSYFMPITGWWSAWLWPALFTMVMIQIQAVLITCHTWTPARALTGILFVLAYGYARSLILLETLCHEYLIRRPAHWVKTPRYAAGSNYDRPTA